jgi:hypothetical protein
MAVSATDTCNWLRVHRTPWRPCAFRRQLEIGFKTLSSRLRSPSGSRSLSRSPSTSPSILSARNFSSYWPRLRLRRHSPISMMKRPSAKEPPTEAYLYTPISGGGLTKAPPARQHALQHVVPVGEMLLERARGVHRDQERDAPRDDVVRTRSVGEKRWVDRVMFGMTNRSKNRFGTGSGDVETTTQPEMIAQLVRTSSEAWVNAARRCSRGAEAGIAGEELRTRTTRRNAVKASAVKPNDLCH